VAEYLFPPLGDSLVHALERKSESVLQLKASRKASGKVIAALSAKGGCGSTTVVCHLASELGRSDNKVLLADYDLEAGIVGFLMKSKSPYSIMDAASNLNRLDFNYWSALTSNGLPGLEIIGSPGANAARRGLREENLRPVLTFVRSHYDWVVVDLGRGFNRVAASVLEDVDETLIVTTFDVPALHQTQNIVRSLLEVGFSRNRLRLILNQSPKRLDATPEELEKMLGLPVFATLPNEADELYEAYSEGKLLGRNSNLAKHFAALASRIAGVQPETAKKTRFGLFK
jgi:pilus assembly protein CpaE